VSAQDALVRKRVGASVARTLSLGLQVLSDFGKELIEIDFLFHKRTSFFCCSRDLNFQKLFLRLRSRGIFKVKIPLYFRQVCQFDTEAP
jgi:hypothetical protein